MDQITLKKENDIEFEKMLLIPTVLKKVERHFMEKVEFTMDEQEESFMIECDFPFSNHHLFYYEKYFNTAVKVAISLEIQKNIDGFTYGTWTEKQKELVEGRKKEDIEERKNTVEWNKNNKIRVFTAFFKLSEEMKKRREKNFNDIVHFMINCIGSAIRYPENNSKINGENFFYEKDLSWFSFYFDSHFHESYKCSRKNNLPLYIRKEIRQRAKKIENVTDVKFANSSIRIETSIFIPNRFKKAKIENDEKK